MGRRSRTRRSTSNRTCQEGSGERKRFEPCVGCISTGSTCSVDRRRAVDKKRKKKLQTFVNFGHAGRCERCLGRHWRFVPVQVFSLYLVHFVQAKLATGLDAIDLVVMHSLTRWLPWLTHMLRSIISRTVGNLIGEETNLLELLVVSGP